MPDPIIPLRRLNTLLLQQGDAVTRALVAVNVADTPFSGIAAFSASYPIRVPPGPQPVTIRDLAGRVLLSRIVDATLTEAPELPEGKRLWTFTLQIWVSDVPARGGTAYVATYGVSPESDAPPGVWESASSLSPLPLFETDIHEGDIPIPFALSDIMDPVSG